MHKLRANDGKPVIKINLNEIYTKHRTIKRKINKSYLKQIHIFY